MHRRVAVVRHVRQRLARDLPQRVLELRPLGECRDGHALGRVDARRRQPREHQPQHSKPHHRREPAPLGERDAVRVVLVREHLELRLSERRGVFGEHAEELGADPVPPRARKHADAAVQRRALPHVGRLDAYGRTDRLAADQREPVSERGVRAALVLDVLRREGRPAPDLGVDAGEAVRVDAPGNDVDHGLHARQPGVDADVVHQSMMLRASSGATTSSLLVRTTTVSPVVGSKATKDV